MIPQHLAIFLTFYTIVVCGLSFGLLIVSKHRKFALLLFLLSLLGVGLSTWIGGLLDERGFVQATVQALLGFSRQEVTAAMLGLCCALPVSALFWSSDVSSWKTLARLFTIVGLVGTVSMGALISARDLISPYLPNPDSEFSSGGINALIPKDFTIENYLDTNIIPVRIAVSPSGKVYVSGHRGIAAQEGAIVELVESDDGTIRESLTARMLNRPYGLIATDDALYVSRSGQYAKWTNGIAEQISTGAVTRLQDLDGDGDMDFYHDVVPGLPGAKGPDYLHQNNGLALGADGALYITTANHTDGHPTDDPFAGAILKASGPDFKQVEVFASGLRNPFGLVFDSKNRLIATDNDSQTGALANLGDKLLEVNEGDFFGHPYSEDNVPGVTKPLLRSTFSLGGLTLAYSSNLPAPYKDSVFVVIFGEGRVMRMERSEQGDADLVPFALVPGATDIAAAPNGDFYVSVYPDKVVRLRLKSQE